MVQNNPMFEHRDHIRFKSLAKVKIKEINSGEALLNDLSVTGCRVECTNYAEITLNKPYTLEITPESEAKIGVFELEVESKWMRTEAYSCEIGFIIHESPKGKLFDRYVDYLSWRYFHGSGTAGGSTSESNSSE